MHTGSASTATATIGAPRQRAGIGGCARCRRGAAEIELLLTIVLIITILMLTKGALQLGLARLDAQEDAAARAFGDAAAGTPPAYADVSATPVEGYAGIRPGLPLRVHAVSARNTVTIYGGDRDPLPPFTVGADVAVSSPSWPICGYPAGAIDRDMIRAWFLDYTAESHEELILPLGLAPAWQP